MIELTIKLYTLDELEPSARERAIEEHRVFLLDTLRPDYIDGVCNWNDPEKMEMYRAEYAYIEDNDDPVVESININEYLFYTDGELVHTVHYVAGPHAGRTVCEIHGESVEVTPA